MNQQGPSQHRQEQPAGPAPSMTAICAYSGQQHCPSGGYDNRLHFRGQEAVQTAPGEHLPSSLICWLPHPLYNPSCVYHRRLKGRGAAALPGVRNVGRRGRRGTAAAERRQADGGAEEKAQGQAAQAESQGREVRAPAVIVSEGAGRARRIPGPTEGPLFALLHCREAQSAQQQQQAAAPSKPEVRGAACFAASLCHSISLALLA